MKRMTYKAWVERFKPISNPFDKNAGIDGCLFQPYGPEWDFVSKQNALHIWTLIITDLTRTAIWTIGEGVHIVNREGYLVTGVAADPNRHYYIRY